MATIDGYVKGTKYNESNRTFEFLKLGEKDNGAIIGGFNVSGKDKNDNRVYGKPIKFKVIIKSSDEGQRVWNLLNAGKLIEAEGFYVPDNYENKDGKEIKGNMFLINKSNTLVEKIVGNNSVGNKEGDKEEPWDA